MSFIIGALKVIFVLGFLIIIHEGGHFLIAKLCKIKVNEFSVGFGKEIISKKKKETKYTLRLIPLGGYVNLLGEEEASNEEGSYSNAPIIKRFAILIAGAAVNIVFGIIVFFILASIVNNSMKSGIIVTQNYLENLVESVVSLFTGNVTKEQVVGPVGISAMIVKTNGLIDLFYMMSVISISLGVTNLLPIPGLDGGKILFLLVELIRRKPLKEDVEMKITLTSLALLLTFAIMVTVKDVINIV